MIHLPPFALPRVRVQLLYTLIAAIGLFFLSPFLSAHRLYVSAAVVINEVYPKPSDEISEWIELYNSGPDQVSLDGWKLENTAGDKKTYTIGPNTAIPAGNFLTFLQSQTALSLYNEGDTVRLLDAGNSQIDSQSYPSTLGYNTSVGRSTDGGGSWTICITPATYNKPNNCPQPTPTSTPSPTSVPTNTPTPPPLPTPTSTPVPTQPPAPTSKVVSPLAQSEVLGETNEPPLTDDFMQTETYRKLWVASLLLALLGLLAMVGGLYKTYKKRL